ncbi:MAG: DUF805 domain-containing protein [Prevotella sp.]|nr:DUF805 domain-containing protein [Prevotella sp.]
MKDLQSGSKLQGDETQINFRITDIKTIDKGKNPAAMSYYERLFYEALEGNKDSFKELKFYAGSGNAEGQYYFALYYAETTHNDLDEDYIYWMEKATKNGYQPGCSNINSETIDTEFVGMTLNEAVKSCFSKYATFTGRASRSEYWMFAVFFLLVTLLFIIAAVALATNQTLAIIIMILYGLFELAVLLPIWAVSIRRFHDIGKSGWWSLVGFIPYIGWIIFLYFMCKKSAPDNKYGKKP